jgi:hypothetical protein
MTFHSFSPREAAMLSVSPDEELASPPDEPRTTPSAPSKSPSVARRV